MVARRLLLGLPLLAACTLGACSQLDGDSSESSESEVSTAGRWRLPADVAAIGAKVKIPYDGAPAWSSKNCAGKLKTGTAKLGEFLRDQFDVVQSVGGYACRANTANKSKMSVHGTGRALDVFIPKVRGQANNTEGDAVANWLVENAERIGVQLVIWDRTVWQANGKNDKAYSGPHPHDDHIHVEVTDEAAALKTPWFTEGPLADGGVVPRRDAGDVDAGEADPADDDVELDPDNTDDGDAGAAPVPTPSPEPAPEVEIGDEPEGEDDVDDDLEVNEEEGRRPTDGDGWDEAEESANDEPGERDSLGPSTKKTKSSSFEDEPLATSSCGVSRSRTAGAAPAALAVLLAASLVRRRRRG